MPNKPLRPCARPGCPNLTKSRYCEKHKKASRQYDKNRPSAYRRGYTRNWEKYRKRYLKEHPLCVECYKKGILEPAEVVDHIIPHKGDMVLFWDPKNHQALSKRCHDRKTAKEDGGFGNKERYKK